MTYYNKIACEPEKSKVRPHPRTPGFDEPRDLMN